MQLTQFTDYSLRVLIFLACKKESSSIDEISKNYDLSVNHMRKVIHKLGQLGYIQTSRGKGGGVKLLQRPENINLGVVIRQLEPNFDLVECFTHARPGCKISPACRLKEILAEALNSFLAVFEAYSLADVLSQEEELVKLFGFSLNK
ncbi:Rrf2 family transcriptional regulator [Piscirickettsia litoralis]|uniref:BadM/Rrf2 family transcriptional regulator n=1 Tax=Piscirickettsia litoralis TaxID=1891921 RepID=A0ABX3A3Y6_9GAMM|nr:Rrf2 family transcriptional regulator [Piscirickettsia litoralis]ODN43587.1 BadM/Rrf2 family transcriptional regulator [Piscirickettsia litoralis]